MALNKNKDLKLYYSITEVAEMFDVAESLLRYWEKEFPTFIKPEKSSRGIRMYKKADIDVIRRIYHLVKEKGMTLQGARDTLKYGDKADLADQHSDVIDRLIKIRDQLQELNRNMSEDIV